jgi:hypothetical protein
MSKATKGPNAALWHEPILAEGLAVESFQPTTHMRSNADEYLGPRQTVLSLPFFPGC